MADILSYLEKDCYCERRTTEDTVCCENEHVTTCITNSLSQENVDTELMVVENYLTKDSMYFSSICLRTFFDFVLNSENTLSRKNRVISILCEHLELHPGCAPYMLPTYKNLLLESEDNRFQKLTLLDYLLCQVQTKISTTEVFSTSRVARRTRKNVAYGENGLPANTTDGNVKSSKEPRLTRDIVLRVLDMLTEVLTHDLRATVNRNESPTKSILAQLIFRSSTSTLNFQPITYKMFEVYKTCSKTDEREQVAKLLELVATLVFHVDRENNESDFIDLGSCCHRFVNDCLTDVFDEQYIREPFSLDKITSLNLIWLRYHAAHHVLKKMLNKKVSSGVKGVVHELLRLTKNGQRSQSNESSPLKSLSQTSTTGIDEDLISACCTDDLRTVERLSEAGIDLNAFDDSGRSALHIAAQHGSVNCASFLLKNGKRLINIELKDNEGFTALMYAKRGGHTAICDLLTSYPGQVCEKIKKGNLTKKLSPLLLNIFMIIADTTIRMLGSEEFSHHDDTVEYLEKLISILKDLSQLNDMPKEAILWSDILDKIEIVD